MSAQSIQSVFATRGSSDLESRLSELRSSDELRELVHVLKVPLAGYMGAAGDLAKALWDLLDLDITDILVKTWNESGVLKKYLNPAEYNPDAEFSVTLSEHKIKSEHHPYLDILLDGVKLLRVILDIGLEFGFDGIVLKIKNARIMEIRTGSCQAKGAVSYKGLQLLKQESGRLDLPGSMHFEKGIPIAP